MTTAKPWSSTAPPGEFQPYVPAEESLAEFTLRAVVLGSLFGLLFGAVTVYVGLPRRSYRLRFDSHRGAIHQHPAGVPGVPPSSKTTSCRPAARPVNPRRRSDVHDSGADFSGSSARSSCFRRIFPLALLGGWLEFSS